MFSAVLLRDATPEDFMGDIIGTIVAIVLLFAPGDEKPVDMFITLPDSAEECLKYRDDFAAAILAQAPPGLRSTAGCFVADPKTGALVSIN